MAVTKAEVYAALANKYAAKAEALKALLIIVSAQKKIFAAQVGKVGYAQ
jgi:hypothetical protein